MEGGSAHRRRRRLPEPRAQRQRLARGIAAAQAPASSPRPPDRRQTRGAGVEPLSADEVRGHRPAPGLHGRHREGARPPRHEGPARCLFQAGEGPGDMNCEQVIDRFLSGLTGDLEAEAQAALESHLTTCTACRESTATVRALWTNLEQLPREQPSEAVRARFYAMLEAWRH